MSINRGGRDDRLKGKLVIFKLFSLEGRSKVCFGHLLFLFYFSLMFEEYFKQQMIESENFRVSVYGGSQKEKKRMKSLVFICLKKNTCGRSEASTQKF